MLHAADLLVCPVLTRDRQAIADLVQSPDRSSTPAAEPSPLIDTLTAYFDTGCVAAEVARRLSLSVRAMTYRLEGIHKLTGADPGDRVNRYALETAAVGARLLDRPGQDL